MRRFWRNSEANTQKGRRIPLEKTWGHDKVDPPNADNIMLAVDSFKPDTAPGISGWTVPCLCLACRSPRVVEFLASLTAAIGPNTAPGRSMLRVPRLTPLLKPSSGIRAIAVSELIYRL